MMKDNLIDEEKAKQEEAAQETIEQKIDRLGNILSLRLDLAPAVLNNWT